MSAMMTDATFLDWITDGAGAASLAAVVADLYSGSVPISRNMVDGDFTPGVVTNVEMPGYAQQTAIGFGSPVRGDDGLYQVRSDPIIFQGTTVPPSPLAVSGCFVRVTAGTDLVLAGEFDDTITVQRSGQFVQVIIVIRENGTVTMEVAAS